ncbi:DEAD/DEAH box helicase [Chachezhania sediminis]|uniref:DEAD/DEAH box helicase n=1 Tax=Chachezhania sediminis TaxID=2599291 RepID=UPI00131DCF2F|nr:DEAD/DEAH box helicase [Chachezhania sediminis]
MITPLSEALAERGYDTLTAVQEAVIDPELGTSDLLVSAQTGSGKTVGFGLAIAPTLLGDDIRFGPAAAPMALVVTPTRELAFQVMRELAWLYGRTGAQVASCVGGMDMRQERRSLERGAHIVVGTPGRLRDHIERGSLDLAAIRAVVLDEADEMLDLGFREDLEFMLGEAPEERRTLLFSATVSPMIAKLAEQFQRDARRISTISKSDQHADIAYQAVRVAAPDAEHAIFNLLRFHHDESAIVFANTRAAVNHMAARLANRGIATVILSGELSQADRTQALQSMRDGRARVCVATDVAARGIDLPNLTLVIHADLPTNTESLLHRSGRTGRAGRKGVSCLIVTPKAVKKAERLLKWAKINAEWTMAPSAAEILEKDETRMLADPAWDDPLTEEQQAFAAKLLALRSPEVIAAAYMRLYQSRNAAPEELLPPDMKTPPRERADRAEFGPSRWFSLSVGQNDRAEARWLLPLLCRAGNLDRSAIGAIRVQDSETYVEIAEAGVETLLASLEGDGSLEEGITARIMDAPPVLPAGRGPSTGKPGPRGDRPGPRGDKPRPRGDRPERSDRSDRPRSRDRDHSDTPMAMRTPARFEQSPAPKAAASDAPAPARAEAPAPKREWTEKRPDRPKPAAKYGRDAGRGDGPASGDRPRGKPAGRPDGKPGGKPAGKFGGKPGGKPDGKGPGKPAGKPFGKGKPGGKPGGKPATTADGRDTSKRFTPPGGAKPGARKPRTRTGGDAPPRRGK